MVVFSDHARKTFLWNSMSQQASNELLSRVTDCFLSQDNATWIQKVEVMDSK